MPNLWRGEVGNQTLLRRLHFSSRSHFLGHFFSYGVSISEYGVFNKRDNRFRQMPPKPNSSFAYPADHNYR
jgi:hypothetical protein